MQTTFKLYLSVTCSILLGVLGGLLVGLCLGLDLSCLCLLHQKSLALGLGLLGVDGLHQHALVLKLVTLGVAVQLVVHVLVDLLGFAVLAKEAAENALAAHPEHLDGHTRIGGTLPSAIACVAPLSLGLHVTLVASLGVDRHRVGTDQVVLDHFTDQSAAGCRLNVVDFGGVAPYSPLAAFKDRCSEPKKRGLERKIGKEWIG